MILGSSTTPSHGTHPNTTSLPPPPPPPPPSTTSSLSSSSSSSSSSSNSIPLVPCTSSMKFKPTLKSRSHRYLAKRKRHELYYSSSSSSSSSTSSSNISHFPNPHASSRSYSHPRPSSHSHLSPPSSMPLLMLPPGHMDLDLMHSSPSSCSSSSSPSSSSSFSSPSSSSPPHASSSSSTFTTAPTLPCMAMTIHPLPPSTFTTTMSPLPTSFFASTPPFSHFTSIPSLDLSSSSPTLLSPSSSSSSLCTCSHPLFFYPKSPLKPLIPWTKWKYELQLTYHLYAAGLIEEPVARHIELMLHQARGVHHNLKVAFEWYESQFIQSHCHLRELAHRLRVFASYNIFFCKLVGWQCLWLEVSSTCQGNQVTKNFRYNSRARLPRYPPCPIHY